MPLRKPPKPVYGPGPTNPPIPVSLGVSKYNYSHAPRPFPNLINPYQAVPIPGVRHCEFTARRPTRFTMASWRLPCKMRWNSRWKTAWTSPLRGTTRGSGIPTFSRRSRGRCRRVVAGAEIPYSTANIPYLNYDPVITSSTFFDDVSTPINNPFISGTGVSSLTGLITHTAQYNNQYSQGFATGTTVTAAWDNTRSSSSSPANFFNPTVQSSLTVTFQQQLLNGFGLFQNRRNILIAKNNRKLADYVFEQQAITTVTNTITAYWELVYARENIKVQQQAVTVSSKLYGDNKKQLEIGTMAPLDVTRAESELATDRQNLIVAQTVQLQDEQILKNAITKDPLAANLINVEIVPTDKPNPPEAIEAATFEDAVKEAFTKRPDLLQQDMNVKNAVINSKATKQALLPTATLTAQYHKPGTSRQFPDRHGLRQQRPGPPSSELTASP